MALKLDVDYSKGECFLRTEWGLSIKGTLGDKLSQKDARKVVYDRFGDTRALVATTDDGWVYLSTCNNKYYCHTGVAQGDEGMIYCREVKFPAFELNEISMT